MSEDTPEVRRDAAEAQAFEDFYGGGAVPEHSDPRVRRGYCVTCVNGPANGWSYVTFVAPDERILVCHKPWSQFEAWYRGLLDEPHPEGSHVYERKALPTEPNDMNVTVDGDWFVQYEVVE